MGSNRPYYNGEQKNTFLDKFLTKFITVEKTRIVNFLANNPEVLAFNLATEMICVGLPIVYVAAITGVPIDELNKLQQVRH